MQWKKEIFQKIQGACLAHPLVTNKCLISICEWKTNTNMPCAGSPERYQPENSQHFSEVLGERGSRFLFPKTN